jgi:hypothetical protein
MMLEKIADALWLTEAEIVNFYGFPYPTRSVIARFDNGDLWVWSPIKLTEALKPQVDGLGRVAHLVSSNKIHYLYLADWTEAYPDAQLWGPSRRLAGTPNSPSRRRCRIPRLRRGSRTSIRHGSANRSLWTRSCFVTGRRER